MTTLITNAALCTRDDAQPFIADGALAYDGTTITAVGPTAELVARYPEAEQIDARGRLVMPGMINAHMHYYSTFARGIDLGSPPPTTFGQILSGLWWKLDKLLTLDDVYYSAIGPMIDAVRMGVTSVIDHHASPHAVRGSLFRLAEAAQLLGLRSNLCYEVSDRDGGSIARAGIAENIEFARYCQALDDDILRPLFGLHAQMTLSDQTLAAATEQAAGLGLGYHIHAAEGIEDVVDCIAQHGCRVIPRLAQYGILSERSIAVHCVQVLDEEIELLAESGVAVVNNPESNMSNAVGTAPVLKMLKAGVLVGLGTDGYCVDMTESLRALQAIQKHVAGLPAVAWAESHLMLFQNNRAIMNRLLRGTVGVLAPGAYADIIILGYRPPTPLDARTLDSHILFGVSGRDVDTTIINGRLVLYERELVGIDEERLLAESRAAAAALWARA